MTRTFQMFYTRRLSRSLGLPPGSVSVQLSKFVASSAGGPPSIVLQPATDAEVARLKALAP